MNNHVIDQTPYYTAIFNPAFNPDPRLVDDCRKYFTPRACNFDNDSAYVILEDGSVHHVSSSVALNAACFNWGALGKIVLAVVISAATALLSDIAKKFFGDIKVDIGDETLININFDKFKEDLENNTKI